MSTIDPNVADADLLKLARRRAGAKLGFLIHASVYAVINIGLFAIDLLGPGRHGHWAMYPALGWGVGLLAHGLSVFAMGRGRPLHDRLVARELAALQRTRRQPI